MLVNIFSFLVFIVEERWIRHLSLRLHRSHLIDTFRPQTELLCLERSFQFGVVCSVVVLYDTDETLPSQLLVRRNKLAVYQVGWLIWRNVRPVSVALLVDNIEGMLLAIVAFHDDTARMSSNAEAGGHPDLLGH